MKTNIYWPIFQNIEREINALMFNIHMDDSQLNVYSSKIIDLILRSAAEIESLAKELYILNSGPKTTNIKYDYDALMYLNTQWKLEDKIVLISSPNCFVTHRELQPFKQSEPKTAKPDELTYSWNNAYQNLKHDRANSLTFGSVKYLLDIAAALYILNIYYRDLTFNLEKDSNGAEFDYSLGSSIFSIKVHTQKSIELLRANQYNKSPDYDQCIYLIRLKADKYLAARESLNSQMAKIQGDILEKFIVPEVNEMIIKGEITSDSNEIARIIKEKLAKAITHQTLSQNLDPRAILDLEYEAVLNKSQY